MIFLITIGRIITLEDRLLVHAEKLLLIIQAPSSRRKSFRQAAAAIALVVENEKRIEHMMELYAQVEELTASPAGTVERNLRGLITLCWQRGGRKPFLELTGLDFPEKPDNSHFIEALAVWLLRHCSPP